ncbi:hypothetical protein SUGI_1085370 [Cryptomeria japonica]|nr:hypothetical protein SUGI_1085370 [Cryptomeria japonica]
MIEANTKWHQSCSMQVLILLGSAFMGDIVTLKQALSGINTVLCYTGPSVSMVAAYMGDILTLVPTECIGKDETCVEENSRDYIETL